MGVGGRRSKGGHNVAPHRRPRAVSTTSSLQLRLRCCGLYNTVIQDDTTDTDTQLISLGLNESLVEHTRTTRYFCTKYIRNIFTSIHATFLQNKLGILCKMQKMRVFGQGKNSAGFLINLKRKCIHRISIHFIHFTCTCLQCSFSKKNLKVYENLWQNHSICYCCDQRHSR